MKLTTNIQKTIIKSAVLHNGQIRKESDVPFIIHPYSVAVILSDYTDDEDTIIAGLLHDVLEDVPNYYEADMKRDFGEKITEIVKGVSEVKDPNNNLNEKETWLYRKNKYVDRLKEDSKESLMVSAADKIHNLNSMMDAYEKRGEKSFENFNSSIKDRLWYHGEVLNVLKERLDNKIVIELEDRYKEAEKFFKTA